MHIFESRYLNLNRWLFMLIGQWPHDARTKNTMRPLIMGTMMVLAIPQFYSVIVHRENTDRLMLSILAFLTIITTWSKMLAMVLRENKMKELYASISDNWLTIRDESERKILVEYSERGRLLTILYSICILNASVNMSLLPLLPKVLDKINPLTKPRASLYLLEGAFLIDRETHFVLLLLCDAVIVNLVGIVCVAIDSMYIVSSQHCCALYGIVSYRLLKLKRMVLDNSSTNEDGDSYEWLVRTIQIHQKALDFTSTLNDSFSMNFLFILTSYLVLIPLTAVAIIANLDNPINILPYALMFAALAINLFVLVWPGQSIFNHGLNLCDDAYCNEWYATLPRTKKLLQTFVLRCSDPALLTAGGLMLMNFETYSRIMRTAMSYITVASSFR